MSGMKPWERDIIEYRPEIGLETHILSIVQKRQLEGTEIIETPTQQFKMTPVVKSALSMLGVDMLEEVIATLSRATALLNRLDSSLSHYPAYINYKKAIKEGDTIKAHRIYLSSLTDINGDPDFDVYPILADIPDEMETYLDFLNQELFDGDADYSDLSIIRTKEEHQVKQLVDLESEDLRITKSNQLTDEQRTIIQKMIDAGTIEADSVDTYADDIAASRLEQGSSRINYEDISTRVQVIATAKGKSGMFRKSVDQIETYIDNNLSTYVGDDLKGSMAYLTDLKEDITQANDSFKQIFIHHANQSKQTYINQIRVAHRDVREFLDKKLSSVRKEKGNVSDRVKTLMKEEDYPETGAQLIMNAVYDSMGASVSTWKFILVEHLGTSEMNTSQSDMMFTNLSEKRRHQTLYKYTDLVNREYAGSNSEKEMDHFISTYKLYQLS